MACLPYLAGLQFPVNIIYFVLNMIIAIISTTGNATVIYVVVTVRRLHSPTNWLLAAMALSDLFSALIGQTVYSVYLSFLSHTSDCAHERTGVYISAMTCGTSLLLLCMITRDRYLHVAKGLRYRDFTGNKQILFLVLLSWLIGSTVAVTFALSGQWQQILGNICFSSLGFSCFLYIVITYRRLRQMLRNHFSTSTANASTDDPSSSNHAGRGLRRKPSEREMKKRDTESRRKQLSAEKSSNRSVLMIVSLFAAVWFPFLAVMLICFVFIMFGLVIPVSLRVAFVWSSILSYVNGAINPMIYATRYKELGREMKRVLLCRKKNKVMITHRSRTKLSLNEKDKITTLESASNNQT